MPVIAGAQTSASASATVTAVVAIPLVVTKTSDLDFDRVDRGTNKTIDVTSNKAASFSVVGEPGVPVNVTFSLPTVLDGQYSVGSTLPIGTWTGQMNTTNSPSSGSSFDPSVGSFSANLDATTGALYFFIGATVQPSASQDPGVYQGTLMVTVSYL
jgi:hypothetical protein